MGTIQFKDINKIYPGGNQAIFDFNLDVKDGEFIVLVGPSGCGKSTILRMLGGLELITSGELTLDGKVINNDPPVERDIAIVFQDYALYGNLSVYDNVGISMKLRHKKDTEIYSKVMEAAEASDIIPYLDRLPAQLSGGQKQRVALARAIMRKPKAFLMDEPLSNLDAKLRNTTRVEIMKLQRRLGVTTIYVTHDQTEAMTMADRIVVIRDGRIQQTGTPMEIYTAPNNIFVAGFIGVPQINLIKGTLKAPYFVFNEHRFRLPDDVVQKLRAYNEKQLVLGVRSEAFLIAQPGEENAIKTELVQSEYLGSHIIAHTMLDQWAIQCKVDNVHIKLDRELYLKPNMNNLHFFDCETTNAILHTGAGGGDA